jgi:hypothetical protein
MERIGVISRRVLAGLVAGNDNEKGAGSDARTSPAEAPNGGRIPPRVEERRGPPGATISPFEARSAVPAGVTHIVAEPLPVVSEKESRDEEKEASAEAPASAAALGIGGGSAAEEG